MSTMQVEPKVYSLYREIGREEDQKFRLRVKKITGVANISITTIKCSINKVSLHGWRPCRKPLLNSRYEHLNFAQENKNKTNCKF